MASFCPHLEMHEAGSPSAAELELHQSMLIARALKMGGLEALLFAADASGKARPVISAMLDRLPVSGMNT